MASNDDTTPSKEPRYATSPLTPSLRPARRGRGLKTSSASRASLKRTRPRRAGRRRFLRCFHCAGARSDAVFALFWLLQRDRSICGVRDMRAVLAAVSERENTGKYCPKLHQKPVAMATICYLCVSFLLVLQVLSCKLWCTVAYLLRVQVGQCAQGAVGGA